MTEQQFNDMYWASKPNEVQTLIPLLERSSHDQATLAEVESAAFELAKKGFVIDKWIMVIGCSPFTTMLARIRDGYTWYPSLMQPPVAITPGTIMPGVAPYDPNNPPAGSIKVSIDPKDYPAFNPPKPVEIPTAIPAKPMFAISQGAGRFSVLPGDSSPAGTVYEGPEGSFVKKVVASPFGSWAWWEVK